MSTMNYQTTNKQNANINNDTGLQFNMLLFE